MNKPFFRAALGGYNKKDVNSYILQKSEEHEKSVSDIKKEADEQIKSLNEKICAAETSLSKAEAENKALCEKLEMLTEEKSLCKKQISLLGDTLKELSSLSGKLDSSLSEMKNAVNSASSAEEKPSKKFPSIFNKKPSSENSRSIELAKKLTDLATEAEKSLQDIENRF